MSYLYGEDGPTEPELFTDMLGQEIRVGDWVAYAIRSGNSGELKAAIVLEITWHEKMDGGYWTWKVKATHESWYGSTARELPKSKPSSPTVGRAVRFQKGDGWK